MIDYLKGLKITVGGGDLACRAGAMVRRMVASGMDPQDIIEVCSVMGRCVAQEIRDGADGPDTALKVIEAIQYAAIFAQDDEEGRLQ